MSLRTHGEATLTIIEVELLKKIVSALEKDCDSCDHCGACELARKARAQIEKAAYYEEHAIL